jgi:hypothetical protein
VGDVLLDGARALPKADLPSSQYGFTLKISAPGRHKVEATLRVRVSEAPPDRQVQFFAPKLVQNELRLMLPSDVSFVQAIARQGGQRLQATPAGTVLDVALGRISSATASTAAQSLVTLRWQQQASAVPALVQFREAYLWDLSLGSSTLTGLLDYKVSAGAITALTIDLPADLEVRAVESRRAGFGSAVRLRDWRLEYGARPALRVEFSNPVRGEFQLGLELAPTGPLPGMLLLPLPAPRGQAIAGGSFVAYRHAAGARLSDVRLYHPA